jgi:hypothetical protein
MPACRSSPTGRFGNWYLKVLSKTIRQPDSLTNSGPHVLRSYFDTVDSLNTRFSFGACTPQAHAQRSAGQGEVLYRVMADGIRAVHAIGVVPNQCENTTRAM